MTNQLFRAKKKGNIDSENPAKQKTTEKKQINLKFRI